MSKDQDFSEFLFDVGNKADEERAISKYLQEYEQSVEAFEYVGLELFKRGRFLDALDQFLKCLNGEETTGNTYINLLRVYIKLNALGSIEILNKLIIERVSDVSTLLKIIDMYQAADRLEFAVILLENLNRSYQSNQIKTLLVHALKKSQQYERIFELVQNQKFLTDIDANICFQLGYAFDALRMTSHAEFFYNQGITVDPKHVQCLLGLSICYGYNGDFAAQYNLISRALEIDPENSNALYMLSRHQLFQPNDVDESRMLEIVINNKASVADKVEVEFSLFYYYEKLNRHEEAFKHLVEGNKLQKSIGNYDIDRDFEDILQRKSFGKNLPEVTRGGNFKPIPIFIVGMPRSGTTLLDKIISSHSDVACGEELLLLPNLVSRHIKFNEGKMVGDIEVFRQEYFSKLAAISPGNETYVTDKLPFNFAHLYIIKKLLPEAKIILIERDREDVILSNFSLLFDGGGIKYSYDKKSLEDYYDFYQEFIGEFRSDFRDTPLVKYENLVSDPDIAIQKLISNLGLKWDDKCLTPQLNRTEVRTASVGQIDAGINKKGINRWHRYKELFASL